MRYFWYHCCIVSAVSLSAAKCRCQQQPTGRSGNSSLHHSYVHHDFGHQSKPCHSALLQMGIGYRRYADRIICTGLLYSLSQKVSCLSFVCFLLVLRFVMYCESRGNILRCTKNNVRLVQTPCSTSLFGANVTSRSVDNYCQAWPSLSHTHLSIIN